MAIKQGDSTNNWMRGTAEYDLMSGLDGNDVLWGLGGDDILSGNNGHDVLVGGAGSDWLHGDDGNDVLIGGAGKDHLYGGAGNDVLIGGEGAGGHFSGGAGADVLLSYEGSNAYTAYMLSPEGVTVNLATGRGQGGDAEGDVLIGIQRVTGSAYDDTLTGDEQDNYLQGGAGADLMDGGGGIDTASFHPTRWHEGVTVDLEVTDAEGWTVVGGGRDGAVDKVKNIENLAGSHGDDTLRGDSNVNKLEGWGGSDVLEGRGGADILDGGSVREDDSDTASYESSPGGVTVDLTLTDPQLTENNHDAAGDTLIDIENLVGSNHSDWLMGDDGENVLKGGAGTDMLDGGDGVDTLYGGTGADTFIFYYEGVLSPDVVKDFSGSGGDGDKLDLSKLKLDMEAGATLTFLAAKGAAFTGVAGQVKWRWGGEDTPTEDDDVTHVQVDMNGDGNADFQVDLTEWHTVTVADLILA